MIIQDQVLKEALKNVFFISGTPCGGKTTVSSALAKRHNLTRYDIDEQFQHHKAMSSAAFQPAMNQQFENADAFFGRSVDAYAQWILDSTREQLDFVLLDLIRLSQNRIVLCDCHLTVGEADCLTDASRVVFLIKESCDWMEDYCNRPDHKGFRDFINSATDPDKAGKTLDAVLSRLNLQTCGQVKNSGYLWIERDKSHCVEDVVNQVEAHFGLS